VIRLLVAVGPTANTAQEKGALGVKSPTMHHAFADGPILQKFYINPMFVKRPMLEQAQYSATFVCKFR
jgi:hypothetical protein